MVELRKIQSELKAPKNQTNAFGRYKYRSCEDILEGLKPHLLETKCILTLTDDVIELAGVLMIKATAMSYVTKLVETFSMSTYGDRCTDLW